MGRGRGVCSVWLHLPLRSGDISLLRRKVVTPGHPDKMSVRDIGVTFGRGNYAFHAVRGVSFDIYRGETFGIVGESGSGKTTIGRTIMRIQPLSAGEILFRGQRISGRIPHALDREITTKIQMIFQDPMASLNERAKVEYIVAEGLDAMHKHLSREYVSVSVSRTLSAVGLLP